MAKQKKKDTMAMPGTAGGATIVFKDEPNIIEGSHSTRIEHSDGRVEFITNWEALQHDVSKAIADYEKSSNQETKPKKAKKQKEKVDRVIL